MKQYGLIGVLWLVLMAGCGKTALIDTRRTVSPQPELAAIDSVMWSQPDSALAMLLEFASGPEADSLDKFNGHYCQLLVSELLYKNDYEQTNREDLLKAVAYFDTVDNVFLAARAHYINGVGYYERDSVVEACEEYLTSLETMENAYGEKALTKTKAAFMFYTYNRLLELFSSQFMMDPAIACGENALAYCQKEPSLFKEIPNTYFHIGRQYDKKGEKTVASMYYSWAIEGFTDTNSLIYRDAVSMKALCDYQLGLGVEQSLETLKQTLSKTEEQGERTSRFLAIGAIYMEEGVYDSALHYFEPIFESETDVILKIRVAESLLIVYDSLGKNKQSDECMRFLAIHKKPEGENKSMVSILEDLYKDYLDKKQATISEVKHKKSIRNTTVFFAVLAFLIALTVMFVAKKRNNKQLKENEALQKGLQKRERQVDVLERALNQRREKEENRHKDFLNEAVCQRILDLVHGLHITSRDTSYQHGITLNNEDYKQLRDAVEKHYEGFDSVLLGRCAVLKQSDLALCHLCLLGLNESAIAALKGRTYSAIVKQSEKLQEKLGIEETVTEYVLKVVERLYRTPNSLQDVPQGVPQEISQIILEIVSSNPKVTREEIANQLGVSTKTVSRYLKKLAGRIRFVGSGYSGHWEVIN